MDLPIMQFLHASVPCFLLGPNIFLSTLFSSINPLKPKCRLLYLKTQFVPRSKHLFISVVKTNPFMLFGTEVAVFF